LAEGESVLIGALESEDTRVMAEALAELGVHIDHVGRPFRDRDAGYGVTRPREDVKWRTLRVRGCGGQIVANRAELSVANSGTSMRFLTPLVALGRGTFRLDGTPRMRERPIEDLLQALTQLGVDAQSERANGCPPVVVHAAGLPGGRASVAGNVSSQFLSGLLMAGPYAARPLELQVAGSLVSAPYVGMTVAVMAAFGVAVKREGLRRFVVPSGQRYRGREYSVEPDASAASYFFAAAAVTGGKVTVEGLSRNSLQGDVAFCDCLARMGCDVHYGPDSITVLGRPLCGITVDMSAISDTVQTLAAVALFAEGPTIISGVAHVRHKETDRLRAVATELRKLGATVEEREDGLRIVPGPREGAEIETYDDHRMAMSMAIAGLGIPGVVIRDPGCTAKTYPEFFADLERLAGGG
jgi:3-phosphoshikimate 1-carboxyvinyltransferase